MEGLGATALSAVHMYTRFSDQTATQLKRDNVILLHFSSFEMSCPSPLENKHKSFSSKLFAQHTLNGFKPRNLQKTKGMLWQFEYWPICIFKVFFFFHLFFSRFTCKVEERSYFDIYKLCFCFVFSAGINTKLVDSRPSSLAKFFSSGSGQEPGNTSSSEGEKDSPPPEWDSVPIPKAGSCKYS